MAIPIELKGKEVALGLVTSGSIVGDDEEDTVLLREMFDAASLYISSFSWCGAVLDSYFGGGVGGIFAVFFFHIRRGRVDIGFASVRRVRIAIVESAHTGPMTRTRRARRGLVAPADAALIARAAIGRRSQALP